MTTIPTTLATGDTLTAAHVDSFGLALKALGITDDNAGDPILARSLGLPVAANGFDTALRGFAVAASSTYTVPASTWAVITWLDNGGTSAVTVTPSGGSALTVTPTAQGAGRAGLVLGAGDQLTLGANAGAHGFEMAAPADLTRVLETVTNAVTKTIGAGTVFVLTHASAATATRLTIGGTAGVSVSWYSATYGASPPIVAPNVYVNQSIASNSANAILISGVTYTK